jgi:hypothetical protein
MDVQRRIALGWVFCILWREIDVDPSLIVQEGTGEVKLLDAPVGNSRHPLEFGRLLGGVIAVEIISIALRALRLAP